MNLESITSDDLSATVCMESVEIAPRDSSSAVWGRAMDPLAGQLGDRYGLPVRPVRVSVGIWRRVLNLLIASDDPGTMGRTRSRIRVFQGSASAAFLSGCSCRCYVTGASPAGNGEA